MSLEKMFSKKELQVIFLALSDSNEFIDILEDKVRDILCFSPHLNVKSELIHKVSSLTPYQFKTLQQIQKEGIADIVFAETHPVVQ